MSREEVLDRIREAEARRRSTVEEARRQNGRMVTEARKEARRILDDAAAEAARTAMQRIQAETKTMLRERQLVVEEGHKRVALQREKSAARLPAAVDRICQEFLRSAHD